MFAVWKSYGGNTSHWKHRSRARQQNAMFAKPYKLNYLSVMHVCNSQSRRERERDLSRGATARTTRQPCLMSDDRENIAWLHFRSVILV